MSAGEYCNRDVVIIRMDDSVREAVNLFRQHHVGCLVVIEENRGIREPVGIVTDRDIVIEVLAEGVDIDALRVADIMSGEVVSVSESVDLLDTIRLMQTRGVRRIPVTDERGGLVGILSVDDVFEILTEHMASLAGVVTSEIRREQAQRS